MSPDTRPACARRIPNRWPEFAASSARSRRQWGHGQPVPTGTIPDAPGSYQFKDAEGRVIYVGQGQEPAAAGCRTTSRPARPAAAHRARWCATAETVEWIAGPQRGRGAHARVQPHQAAPAPVQHPAAGRQELPVPRGHARRGVAAGDGDAGRASARASATSGRTRHAYAIRETLDLLLRTFPIRTCTRQQVRPAPPARSAVPARSTSRSARPVRRRDRRRRRTTRSSHELLDFLDGEHRRDRQAARDARCARRPTSSSSSGRPACATGSHRCARRSSASRWSADRNEDLDVIGIADDELEAAVQVFYVRKGRVVGRKGFVVDKVEDLDAPASSSAASSSSSTATTPPLGVPKQVLVPVEPDDLDLYEECLALQRAARKVRDPRAAARRQARAAGDGHAQRARRSSPATGCAARPTTTPGPGAERAAGRARPARGAAAHRVLRHVPHLQGTDYVGSMVVMEDGLPKRSDYRRFKIKDVAGQRRLRGDGGGAHPAAPPLPATSATKPRGERRASGSPTRRNLLLVDGGKGQLGVAVRVLEELGLDEEIPVASLAKRFEEVYVPGPSRSGAHPAPLRGALPAAADPRRGPPLRHHVPPRAARQADDHVGARRRRRASARPAQAAAQGARRREGGRRTRRSRSCRRCRGCPTRWPTPSTRRCTAIPARDDRPTATCGRANAGWWQDGFTDGADPEYEEQILPLAAERLARRRTRARRRVRRGAGRPARRALGGVERVVGVDPTWRPDRGGRRARRRPGVRPRPAPARCRSPTARSTPSSPASCSSTSTTSTTPSPRWPACCAPGGRFLLLPQPPAAADAEQRLDRRPDPRPARAVLAHRPVPRRGRDDRGGGEGRVHPVHPPPAEPLRQRARGQRPVHRAHGGAGAAGRASSPAPPSTRAAATIPRLMLLLVRALA